MLTSICLGSGVPTPLKFEVCGHGGIKKRATKRSRTRVYSDSHRSLKSKKVDRIC